MKISASILLFYFLFLTSQPLIPLIQKGMACEDEQCTMSCCHKKQPKPVHKMPIDNCWCNPFGQYACCLGYITERKITSPIALSTEVSSGIIFNENIVSAFHADCWRPPENTVS